MSNYNSGSGNMDNNNNFGGGRNQGSLGSDSNSGFNRRQDDNTFQSTDQNYQTGFQGSGGYGGSQDPRSGGRFDDYQGQGQGQGNDFGTASQTQGSYGYGGGDNTNYGSGGLRDDESYTTSGSGDTFGRPSRASGPGQGTFGGSAVPSSQNFDNTRGGYSGVSGNNDGQFRDPAQMYDDNSYGSPQKSSQQSRGQQQQSSGKGGIFGKVKNAVEEVKDRF